MIAVVRIWFNGTVLDARKLLISSPIWQELEEEACLVEDLGMVGSQVGLVR